MQEASMHEALAPIAWLAGRWTTKAGHGSYPNINDFSYHDELIFTSIGQPMLNFQSTSKHPEKGTPLHQERGFLRIKPGTNELALLVSHNMGLVSVEEGFYDPETKEINLKTVSISRMSFAKSPTVKSFERKIKLLSSDMLEVVTYMATDATELTEHLKAVYNRAESL